MRLSQTINRIADTILRQAEDYKYSYDPEHRNRPDWRSFETEKGWSNDPKDDPKNKQPTQENVLRGTNPVDSSHAIISKELTVVFEKDLKKYEEVSQEIDDLSGVFEKSEKLRFYSSNMSSAIRRLKRRIQNNEIESSDVYGKNLKDLIDFAEENIAINSFSDIENLGVNVSEEASKNQEITERVKTRLAELYTQRKRIKNSHRLNIHSVLNKKGVKRKWPEDFIVQSTILRKSKFLDSVKDGVDWSMGMLDYRKIKICVFIGKNSKKNSSYVDGKIILLADNSDSSTFIHELGHHIETHIPDLKELAKDFYKKRTEGKPLIQLNKIEPERGCSDEVMVKDGGFLDKYIGRFYDDGATEIISSGIEHFYRDPFNFKMKDPEHFEIALHVLLRLGYGNERSK